MDEQGFTALAHELEALTTRIQKIEADSKARLARTDHEGEQPATVVLMLFNSAEASKVEKGPKVAAPVRVRTQPAQRRA